MARRAWTNTDPRFEYDYHRLDLRIIGPASKESRFFSIFLPMTDWPDVRFVTPGRMVSLRLKVDDLEAPEPPLFSTYSLAELQMKRRPNQALQPTRMLGTSAAEQPRVPSTRVADL